MDDICPSRGWYLLLRKKRSVASSQLRVNLLGFANPILFSAVPEHTATTVMKVSGIKTCHSEGAINQNDKM